MRVLVTGGAGFIGSNLCQRLIADDRFAEVRVIDDLSTGFVENLHGLDLAWTEASILDECTLKRVMTGVDAVVHLAALGSVPRSVKHPQMSHDVNATGTLRVLIAAREVGAHVVLSSSSSVYGANKLLPKSETMQCLPMSPYAVTKLAAEQYAMAFANVYGMEVLPFRFFNVYGPNQRAGHAYAAVVPAFVDAALRGEPLYVNGDGKQSRDFTYVGSVVDALVEAIAQRKTGSPTNLAFGTRTTLLELIDILKVEIGSDLTVVHRASRDGDVPHSQADFTRLRELMPNVSPTSLGEGVRATVEWMRAMHC